MDESGLLDSSRCGDDSALHARLKLLAFMQIVLWTSGIVVLSLLINAPLTPVLLRWTGLCDISGIKVWDIIARILEINC